MSENEIDTVQIRGLIEKHGPPLSPMLIWTLLDEIDRLRGLLYGKGGALDAYRNAADQIERLQDQVDVLERTFVQPILDRINKGL